MTYGALAIFSNLVSGIGGTVAKYIGWGTGAGTSARGDTSLFTEAYSTQNNGTGNQRTTATVSRVTTSQTNDSIQLTATLTAPTGGLTVTNCGAFDSQGTSANLTTAPSGGNLMLKSDFTGIALNASDSISFQLTLQFT